MRSGTRKRVAKVERVLGTARIPRRVTEKAVEAFRTTGVLPDDEREAAAVIKRVKMGYDLVYRHGDELDWGGSIEAARNAPDREADPILDDLYCEAVHATGMVRWAARHVLESYASLGRDVTQPLFVGWDCELPDYGSTGMHLLGFPERLAQKPYTRQAKRLFKRAEELRGRIPRRDRRWMDSLQDALEDWLSYGELPEDELVREAVLVEGEMDALVRHFAGEDVREVMAGYDRVAGEQTRETLKILEAAI